VTADPATWTLPRLRIDRDGAWYHDDAEVTHAGILANLRGNLQVDEQGHYLRIGPVRVPVEVEDAPFVVERVEVEARDQGPWLRRAAHITVVLREKEGTAVPSAAATK